MNLLTPEQRAREVELKSIYQYCDKTKRLLLSADDATDIDKRRALIAEYNRRVRAVNVRILKITMTEWEGGARPVSANELIDCVLADGTVLKSRVAGNLEWQRGVKDVTDIIRYRVIK